MKADLKERLAAAARVTWPLEQLLPDVRAIPDIEQTMPRSVSSTERKLWVDEQRAADDETALARIDGAIRLDSVLAVQLVRGKLAFLINEQEVARVFVSDDQEQLVAAQWRAFALDFQPGGRNDARRLIDQLRKVVVTAPPALATQIFEIGAKLASLSEVIEEDERQLHELTALLFNLPDEEERQVLQGRV